MSDAGVELRSMLWSDNVKIKVGSGRILIEIFSGSTTSSTRSIHVMYRPVHYKD